ncbi:N-acetylmuramidase [Ligilactobacillus salitolerans]|uniref:N-acetylmuramidase n=1 Tax=Ligilactobacillus salitolerans TaxID=1808352 RepID=A0A401IT57_9LACO|nr:glycoside hydrolase family 73 protein [Ligilactobacillus salitolerans]GBG94730.1 N-acetylmuramidase [Ligilactobacillus salitolerans]
MAQKKSYSQKKKPRKKTSVRRYPRHRRGQGPKLADIVLLVLVVTLIAFQSIRWFEKKNTQPATEQTTQTQSKQAFIRQLVPSAQKQQRERHLFTSITLAQACLESNFGQSELSQKYHNLFGIKSSDPNSPLLTTKEYVNGQWITVKARFMSYANYDESIRAHTMLFVNGTGWDAGHYQAVLNAANYREAAQALQDKGYATDPDYAQKLIDLIEEYKLNQYDLD